MNKLKKLPPSPSRSSSMSGSMTMRYAASTVSSPLQSSSSFISRPNLNTPSSLPKEISPLTATEQYWATRALKAEALLAAHEKHKSEVKTLGEQHDLKRQQELARIATEYREKHASLERLLTFLLLLVAFMGTLIIYLATHYTRHSMSLHHKQTSGWWSAIGASHFTIPILSPFTSVTEHESSVVNTKMIATLGAFASMLLYLIFRHWYAHRVKASPSPSFVNHLTRAIDR